MLVILYVTFLGLVIGSAINAIVWRLYVGRSWVHGRSMCPECKHELKAKDLVPVLSWVLLGGKCRYCKAKIHWQYPVVEAVTALLFGLSAAVLPVTNAGTVVELAIWLLLLVLLIILAVYDARWLLLPDKVMVPAIGTAAVLMVVHAVNVHSLVAVRGPLTAAFAMGGFFLALVVGTRGRAMGGGDIKLVFAMGLALGLRGGALALLVAFDIAAIIGVGLIILRRRSRKDQIPFGPFLVGGTILAYLYGGRVIEWYLRWNGLA